MTIELDSYEASFEHKGKNYEVTGSVTHETHTEDVGIGSYEYWGHTETDKQLVEISEYVDAEFHNLQVFEKGSEHPVLEPSAELTEAAELALFGATYEYAEQVAAEGKLL
jgi:hypothetical protein